MPYLTAQFSGDGPFIDLLVGVSQPRQQALAKSKLPIAAPVRVRGLIDTGASCTCIDPEVIQQLGLVATGTTSIITPSTGDQAHTCLQYDVSLFLSHPELAYRFAALPVIESRLKHQGIMALIGRDVLCRCLFVYDGRRGSFSLAF
jgi:hypothetical protein